MELGAAAFWGTILAAVSGLLGMLFTKGIEALLRFRADRRIDTQYKDQQVVTGYEFVIASLKEQNDKLEHERKDQIGQLSAALTQVRGEHIDCVKVQEGLRVQTISQQQDIETLQGEVRTLRSQVDKLRGN